MDWFDTMAEILEILKRTQKKIMQQRAARKRDSDLKSANNN